MSSPALAKDIAWLNGLPQEECRAAFTKCCGSGQWVEAMLTRRPFASQQDLFRGAEEVWNGLPREQWLEAFSHHPKIGDMQSMRAKFATTEGWAKNEQSGVAGAGEETLRKLADGNRLYQEKFGYIFIVCATGKSAPEMLAILESRIGNSAERELPLAASEQAKITRLRLEKLFL